MISENDNRKLLAAKSKFYKTLEIIATEGTVSRITGKMRSGKTDYALRLCEIILNDIDPNLRIMTNIVIDWEKFKTEKGNNHPLQENFVEVTSLRKLFWTLTEIDHGLLVLDEAGVFASSGASGKRKEIGQWEQIIKLIRKFHVSIIWIDQRGKGSTPPTVRAMSSYHVHKPFKYKADFYEVDYDQRKDDVIERKKFSLKVPPTHRTSIPYDTYSPGSFEMELGSITRMDDHGKESIEVLTARTVFDYLRKVKGRRLQPTLLKWLKMFNIECDDDEPTCKEGDPIDENDQVLVNRQAVIDLLDRRAPIPDITEKMMIFRILDKAKERGEDPPSTRTLAKIFFTSDPVVSRIKKQWREQSDA